MSNSQNDELALLFNVVTQLRAAPLTATTRKVLRHTYGAMAELCQSLASEVPSATDYSYSVVIRSVGPQKINVIKVVRELTRKGLADAKNLVEESCPVVGSNLDWPTAEAWSVRLQEAGAVVSCERPNPIW